MYSYNMRKKYVKYSFFFSKFAAVFLKNIIVMVRVIGFKGVKEVNNFSSVDERRNVIRVKKTLFGRMIEEAREKVMLILVKNFGRLRYEDIEEVYSDGCLVLWNKMESDSLELGGEDLVKYFIRICKNIGSHYLRKVDDRFVSFEDFVCEGSSDEEDGIVEMFDILDEVVISDDEKYKKLDKCWEKLKEVDRMILESYYWEGVKMDEIARRIGYKNADSVKSKKNKVLKKMMEMMKTEEGSHELPSLVFGNGITVCSVRIIYRSTLSSSTVGDIPVPFGYTRVEASPGSYAEYLRSLPLRNLNPLENPWFFFDGTESTLWVSVFHFDRNELRHY